MARQKIRIGFWATKCYKKWTNQDMKKLYNKILKIEDELEKIRDKIFEEFTE